MYPMNEAEENTLRVLSARMRDESPDEFIALLMDVLIFKFEPDSMVGIQHKDGDGIPDAMLVVFTGTRPAEWARKALQELQKKQADLQGKRPPDGDTDAPRS